MSSILVVENVELIPVLKLEPFLFATEARSPPSGIYEDMAEEWYRYWVHSLADVYALNLGLAGAVAEARMEVAAMSS